MQAALGSLPTTAVNRAYAPGTAKHTLYAGYAQDVLTTAVFEIIISGTLGCLMVRWLSPLLLKQVPLACAWRRHFNFNGKCGANYLCMSCTLDACTASILLVNVDDVVNRPISPHCCRSQSQLWTLCRA